MKKILLPFLLAGSIFANDLNIEITNYSLALNTEITIPKNPNYAVRGTYLYNDKPNQNNYFSIGFQAQGENALDQYNSKLAIFIDFDHTKDNGALPIGISLFNKNFGNTTYPLFGKMEVGYSPAVLSFDNATRFLKVKAEIGVKPIKNAKVFVGYRKIRFNENYQSLGYAGIGFIF